MVDYFIVRGITAAQTILLVLFIAILLTAVADKIYPYMVCGLGNAPWKITYFPHYPFTGEMAFYCNTGQQQVAYYCNIFFGFPLCRQVSGFAVTTHVFGTSVSKSIQVFS